MSTTSQHWAPTYRVQPPIWPSASLQHSITHNLLKPITEPRSHRYIITTGAENIPGFLLEEWTLELGNSNTLEGYEHDWIYPHYIQPSGKRIMPSCALEISVTLYSTLDSMNKSFSNSSICRGFSTTNSGSMLFTTSGKSKLMFVASKIVSEPELAGQQEVVPLLSQLLSSRCLSSDGEFGRPIPGFLHPTIAEQSSTYNTNLNVSCPLIMGWLGNWISPPTTAISATNWALFQSNIQYQLSLFPFILDSTKSSNPSLNKSRLNIQSRCSLSTLQCSSFRACCLLSIARPSSARQLVTLPIHGQGDEEEWPINFIYLHLGFTLKALFIFGLGLRSDSSPFSKFRLIEHDVLILHEIGMKYSKQGILVPEQILQEPRSQIFSSRWSASNHG